MPPIDEPEDEEKPDAPIKSVIGIIYPPPEVRNIVDKTASFVARNGPEFETRIRQNEINNPKFNFLNQADPYYAYYQHKVKEFREGKGQEPAAPKQNILGISQHRPAQETQAKIIQEIIPKEPPPDYEFVADPPSISAFDLDVVKLTAQFVARNGRQFLTNLMNREQRNYQFDFLRPQHSLFNYFTKLVEQYTKILIPPKDLMAKLRRDAENPKAILDQVRYRVEWAKFQERERKREEEEKERERVAYASIDWHDFVVVETVDFQPYEMGNLPPPTTPEEVGARLLAQERFETTNTEQEAVEMEVESDEEMQEGDDEDKPAAKKTQLRDVNIEVQDMEEDSDEEKEDERPHRGMGGAPPAPTQPPPPPPPPRDTPQPPPLPPTPDQVIVRKDYNPKAPKPLQQAPAPDQFLVSPITGEKIPADKIQEHMRIGLLDPKWIEQRDRVMASKQDREEVYAAGSAIDSSLKMLAERRTDIFGSGTEETQIGKKIGEEDRRKTEKVIWDGHTASMEKVTQKARENISIEEQIAVIHKAKGLLPDKEKEKIGPAMPKVPLLHPPLGMPVSNRPTPLMPPSVSKPPMPLGMPPMNPPKPAPSSAPKPPPLMQQSGPPKPLQMLPQHQPMAPGMGPPGMGMGMQPPRMMVMAQNPMGGMRPMMGMRPPMPPMMGPGPPMAPMPPRPGPGGYMQPPMPPHHNPPMPEKDDEPPSKKAKTEDQLIPEEVFLQTHKAPVQFNVSVPNYPDKAEWKMTGQTLNFTLPLSDNVSVIKAKISEALGMPAGKQKLQYEGMFIKDSNTLAFYNFFKNSTVSLQLKERGGRKR